MRCVVELLKLLVFDIQKNETNPHHNAELLTVRQLLVCGTFKSQVHGGMSPAERRALYVLLHCLIGHATRRRLELSTPPHTCTNPVPATDIVYFVLRQPSYFTTASISAWRTIFSDWSGHVITVRSTARDSDQHSIWWTMSIIKTGAREQEDETFQWTNLIRRSELQSLTGMFPVTDSVERRAVAKYITECK